MDPILIPTWITTFLLSTQVHAGIQDNAKYQFQIDTDHTIIMMNSQTGKLWRCDPDLKKCEEPKEKHE